MRRVNFDLDVLRSFTTCVELGSFSKAAARLNKSTSAVSAQLKKLEEQAGVRLLRRSGRTLALTEQAKPCWPTHDGCSISTTRPRPQ
jgi:DNA-binding transcriptional LysR family regulator